MFQSKNLSPTKLAFFIATLIAFFSAILVFAFTAKFVFVLVTLLGVGIVSYLLVYYMIERFIYRKIKLIYKFISHTKASKREEFYNSELLPQKTIEDVNHDVAMWAEDRKVEIERLQNNEQFRREFLMNLAHELKTPIFSAQGYIDTLINGAVFDPAVNMTFLQNAERSIDRLSDLVNDLDQISKIESNQIPLSKSNFVVQELIKEVYDELAQKAASKRIKLLIKKGCEQDIIVFADKPKIKQVLVNLINNSINYGKEDGETNAGIYIVDKEQVFVEITDDGMGIQEDSVSRVFERFYRTDSARSRNAGGTGLGLAIVKHIIEAHNHTVTCRSKVDVGTSFGFSLDRESSNSKD